MAAVIIAQEPTAEECPAAWMIFELASLAGPELVMLVLGMLTYILFSGRNLLPAYWSHYDALFPGRLVLPSSGVAISSQKTTSKTLAEEEKEELEDADKEKDLEDADEEGEEVHEEAVTTTTSPSVCPLIDALAAGGLDTNSVAQVFLCLELKHMGQMGATCRAAKEGIWEDKELWLAVGGPNFVPKAKEPEFAGAPAPSTSEDHKAAALFAEGDVVTPSSSGPLSAKKLRGHFRVWVYGLGGDWSDSFADSAHTRHHADVFDEATYLLGGLQKADGAAQIEAFGQCLTEQLSLLDAGERMANQAAFRLAEKAKARTDLLGKSRVREMQKALEASTKYARMLSAHMPL